MAGLRGDDRDGGEQSYYRTGTDYSRARGGWLLPVVGGFVAVLCAGGLWFAYTTLRGGGGSGEPPLIRADQTATKVKPDQPGGDAAPGQDKDVYNMGQQAPTVERLLPPPEQPMAKPAPEEPPPAPAAMPMPPPAQAAVQSPAQAPAATPAPPPPAAKPAPVAAPTPKPVPTQTTPPTVLTPPTQTASRTPPAATENAVGPGFRLQIAATKDEDKAQSEWHRLQNAHPDLLGGLGMKVVKADLGDKGVFYRIQAGPIPEKADADKLCGQLKAVSIGCIVVKTP